MGIDPNGKELFRFALSEETMQNLKYMEGSNRRCDGVHISYKTATTQHDSG